MKFIDHPIKAERDSYERAIDKLAESNRGTEGLRTIYRLGNITTPGISDIDLLFVFEDDCRCRLNGMEALSDSEKRLFTHGIMAMPQKFFHRNNYFAIWSRHEVIWGERTLQGPERSKEEEHALGIQTAMEFFFANYMDLAIQEAYGVFKLRALLQHMKGLLYDLELIGQQDTEITGPLLELKEIIRNWFNESASLKIITDWLRGFLPLYRSYVQQLFNTYSLYLPPMDEYRIAKNMTLLNGHEPGCLRRGLLLPSQLSFLNRNYFKLQNRLNRFIFTCPVTNRSAPINEERFSFLKEMKAYNRMHLPNFMTMTTSLTAKII